MARLARVIKRAVGPQALLGAPPGHLGHVSLGQQQPGMLRGTGLSSPAGPAANDSASAMACAAPSRSPAA